MANTKEIRALGGLLIPVVASDPSSPANGTMWYNSVDAAFKFREAGVTKILSEAEVAALDVSFDNTTLTGDDRFTATDVQAAISESLDLALGALTTHEELEADAHPASAISYDNTLSGLTATEVKSAIDELAGSLDNLDATAIPYDNTSSELTAVNVQDAIDEVDSRIDDIEGMNPINYLGTWDASTNTPTLANGTGTVGDLYQVSAGGTVDFGAGNISFAMGDKVVYNGSIWEKWDMTDAVTSVNSQTGAVVLDSDDIAEGSSNLYFTEARVLGSVLTGYDSTGNTLAATDTVLEGFEKLDAELELKIASVSEDTAPALGGDLDLAGNVIHDDTGLRFGSSDSVFYEQAYVEETLTASQSNAVSSTLTFAHASFEGLLIEYKIKEATTNRIRVGQLSIASNGTDIDIIDEFSQTGDVGVVWDLNISGANTQVRYTTTANDKALKAVVKRIKA